MSEDLEQTVEKHSIQIQELHDEIDFKKWKIDSLIEKIDKLTTVVQEIQINQLKDDHEAMDRISRLESAQSTMKWVVGVGLSALSIVVAVITVFVTILH